MKSRQKHAEKVGKITKVCRMANAHEVNKTQDDASQKKNVREEYKKTASPYNQKPLKADFH